MGDDILDFGLELREFTDEKIKINKALDSTAKQEIGGAVKLLNMYKMDFPADVLGALKTLAKLAAEGYGGHPSKTKKKGTDIGEQEKNARNSVIWPSLIGFEGAQIEKVDEDVDGLVQDLIGKTAYLAEMTVTQSEIIDDLIDEYLALQKKKTPRIRKSIVGQDGDYSEPVLWPSLISRE